MRLRVVSARNEIANLNPSEKMIHLAFRASNVDFLNLMQRCPRLRVIQVPPSYSKTMSNAIQVFLNMQGRTQCNTSTVMHNDGAKITFA